MHRPASLRPALRTSLRRSTEFAILETGLIPSRLRRTRHSPIPINIFVDEIEQAAALLADISENTAEIWLAVGCAVALGIPLCLISSRHGLNLPLGIQYLPLIPYPADAFPSDYTQLQQNIIAQLSAILPQIPPSRNPQTALPQPESRLDAPFLQPVEANLLLRRSGLL